jgi:hypothetical protein
MACGARSRVGCILTIEKIQGVNHISSRHVPTLRMHSWVEYEMKVFNPAVLVDLRKLKPHCFRSVQEKNG